MRRGLQLSPPIICMAFSLDLNLGKYEEGLSCGKGLPILAKVDTSEDKT